MSKFKKGDTVRRIRDNNGRVMPIGSVWNVDGVENGWLMFEGVFNDTYSSNPDYFELVEAAEIESEKPDKQAIDTSGKYVRSVYELVDLSIKGENFTLDMGEIKELIKELQELV